MVATAQVVMFAIQAGVRLYAAGRRVYVEATLDRPLILPLPRGGAVHAGSAAEFFLQDFRGKELADRDLTGLLKGLADRAEAGALSHDEEQLLTEAYLAYVRELNLEDAAQPEAGPGSPMGAELTAILTVRQWSKTERGQLRPLQLIAGTLINIAVDYFAHLPGAVSESRPAGKALKHFLEAIDELDFADTPPADVAGDLLVAVVDSVAANPDLVAGGDTGRKLVKSITQTLARSARHHLDEVPIDRRRQGSLWLQLIARAVVEGSADVVLADPVGVLGVREDEGRFIQEVGGTLATLLIGPDSATRLRFETLLSGDGVNTVIRAALTATANNPRILRVDSEGLRNIIVGVADGLTRQDNLLTDDVFPSLAELVLEHSTANLDLIWPGKTADPAQHLLVTAVRQLFLALAEGTREAAWPTLTRDQLMTMAEVVVDEVVENPDWLIERADLNGSSPLDVTIRASLEALREHTGRRLSADGVTAALTAAVGAVAQRLELLRRLPAGGVNAGEIAIGAAIGAVIDSALVSDGDATIEQRWLRARSATLILALETAFQRLAKIGAEQRHIDVLREQVGALIDQRLTVEEFGDRLEQRLLAA